MHQRSVIVEDEPVARRILMANGMIVAPVALVGLVGLFQSVDDDGDNQLSLFRIDRSTREDG